jgi:hypothetical protein
MGRRRREANLIASTRRRDDNTGTSYSIVGVLKELSALTYELKTLRAMDVTADGNGDGNRANQYRSNEIQAREENMGHCKLL